LLILGWINVVAFGIAGIVIVANIGGAWWLLTLPLGLLNGFALAIF